MAGNDRQAISRARRLEAAYFEATRGYDDSAALRLSALHGELASYLSSRPQASQVADLVLVPGEPPRLWVDLVTAVVMEPNFRTYRIQQEFGERRQILLETPRREEALRFLTAYLNERQKLPGRAYVKADRESPAQGASEAYSVGVVVYAWLTGLVLGLLLVLIAVNMLK